jgi:hypothetical protein
MTPRAGRLHVIQRLLIALLLLIAVPAGRVALVHTSALSSAHLQAQPQPTHAAYGYDSPSRLLWRAAAKLTSAASANIAPSRVTGGTRDPSAAVAPSGFAAEGIGGGSKSVALGLSRDAAGEPLLQPFADARGAFTNRDWIKQGLADEGPFAERFAQATQRAVGSGGRIHFNLDQFSITRGLAADATGDPFEVGVTNWELHQVLGSSELHAATDWWIGGEQLSAQDVLDFGLGPRS